MDDNKRAMQEVSLIVVGHNSLAMLPECLKRLNAYYPAAELIVVDSGSSDGSPKWVQQNYPQAKLLELPNRGYPYAVNRGLEAATGCWIVEMNSDVYLNAGDLEALQKALESEPRAAFAGPTLVTPEGRLQSFGPLYAFNYWNLHQPRSVSWISGALMMVRKEALEEIGGMDERLFLYNEDLEWCARARRKGWKVLLVPRKVLHLGGSSTPKDPRFIAEGYRGGLLYSQDYLPAWHGLHRKAVWLEALLRAHFDPDAVRREGYRLLKERLEGGNLETPFL
jgi:GT2 family glycosyltransferase